jgi:hypothetical protein
VGTHCQVLSVAGLLAHLLPCSPPDVPLPQQLVQKGGGVVSFDGFRDPDYESVAKFIVQVYGLELPKEELATKGWHWGDLSVAESNVRFMVGDKRLFDLPLSAVSQVMVLKDDVQLIMSGTGDPNGVIPHLTELRFAFAEVRACAYVC